MTPTGQPTKGTNGRRTNIRLYDADRENIEKIQKRTGETNTSDIIRRLIEEDAGELEGKLKKDIDKAFSIIAPLTAMYGVSKQEAKVVLDYIFRLRVRGFSPSEAAHMLRNFLNVKHKEEK